MVVVRIVRVCVAAMALLLYLSNLAMAAGIETQKAILVTGASSGIGKNIAVRLAGEGYLVYAGARTPADIAMLSAIENVQGVRLDVTVQADVDAAAERLMADGVELQGVVNNAGVVAMGLLIEIDEAELDFLFDVNVYGPYRIVKAFAPLLIESQGRVVNISSMAGIMSPPGYGAYSMSKHAIEAFNDTLAYELGTVGVGVSAIAPGPFKSNAAASACERYRRQSHDVEQSLLPDLAAELAEACVGEESQFPEPDPVADAVLQALTVDSPKARYLAPSHPQQAEVLARNLLQDLADLSRGQSYGFSRDELIAMLDAALESSKRPAF